MESSSKPVVLYDDATLDEYTYVAAHLPQADVVPIQGPLRPDSALSTNATKARILSTFVRSVVNGPLLDRLPALRLIAVRSANPVGIDLEACRQRGVTVCTALHTGEGTVAEHTFALLLGLTCKIVVPYLEPHLRGVDSLERLRGTDLEGKTLGIVGLGRIGLRVARIARVFGMHVLTFDVHPDPAQAEAMGIRLVTSEDLLNWVRVLDERDREWTIQFVSFDELLARSDIVTLHSTATSLARHLIDAEALSRMKPNALLINTAHGSLVDIGALIEALDSGHLGGAGLDVVEDDEIVTHEDHLRNVEEVARRSAVVSAIAELARRPNVVLSPHNAFNSAEGRARIVDATIETIASYLEGKAIDGVARIVT